MLLFSGSLNTLDRPTFYATLKRAYAAARYHEECGYQLLWRYQFRDAARHLSQVIGAERRARRWMLLAAALAGVALPGTMERLLERRKAHLRARSASAAGAP